MQNIEKPGPSAYVGLIPAAGIGSRLPHAKGAKEMLAVGPDYDPVISQLIDHMARAGVRDITVVMREEKRDLARYLEDHRWHHLRIRQLQTPGTTGVPQTILRGLNGIQDCRVAFGFPDILLKPATVLPQLMQRLDSGSADVVVGLFPARDPGKCDMVGTNQDGSVVEIEIKPPVTSLRSTWSIAVWRPSFSHYLTELMRQNSGRIDALAENLQDQQLGQIFRLALADGLSIDSVPFAGGVSLDIGTPGDLQLAQHWNNNHAE